ncbi:MAG TPA: hypothetical protein VIB48_24925 [Acidimicrobiia bacterium]
MRFRLPALAVVVVTAISLAGSSLGAATPMVTLTDAGFAPATVLVDAVRLNVGATLAVHNASSQSVVLCEQVSSTCGFAPVGQDSYWEFDAAETTTLTTPQFPQAKLVVEVPLSLESASRAGITVRWSSHATPDPSAPSRFDVQWRRAAPRRHPRWHDLEVATVDVAGTLVPRHPGRYVFRARLCDLGAIVVCSGWSPELHAPRV